MKYRFVIGLLITFLMGTLATAQEQPRAKKHAIQFSGVIVTDENSQMVPVPFANVYIANRHVGTTSGLNGFFSIVAERGEKVSFSAVGFMKVDFKVPDTLQDDRYSLVQIMSRDTVLLAEAVIFPWPNRDRLKTEFLAMDVHDEMQRRAMENLAKESLDKIKEVVPHDGRETGSMYLRQQAKTYYYYGQTPPMNIFSPTAWGEFFKAWKNGDFKKQ
jgi:CarboxypepD_reg-like domain